MHQGDIFMEGMESRTRGPTLKSHMQSNPLEWPWEGDMVNIYQISGGRKSLSSEATENVTRI